MVYPAARIPVFRTYSAKTSAEIVSENKEGFLKRISRKIPWLDTEKIQLKATSYYLYENVIDQIDFMEFFIEFDMPDTFNSWFLVTELHVWLLLTRAMAEGSDKNEDGRFLRNNIVEAMWADVNLRSKKLGESNPSGIRRQVQVLSEEFQAALIAYDEGVMSDDKVLASAIWRRFLSRQCEDYTKLESLVKYIRMNVHNMDNLSRRVFLKERQVKLVPLQDCLKI